MDRLLLVFDGDDTLWFVEHLYDEARNRARRLVEHAGLDGERWEQLERRIDVEKVASIGVTAERFPTSCVEAYMDLAGAADQVDLGTATAVFRAAQSVFEATAPLVPGATAVLAELRESCPLALLTKGDRGVQEKRIEDSGLRDYFDGIWITPTKGAEEFSKVLAEFGFTPGEAWSIGNSLASDINPALSIGMGAVWIDAHVWEHERRETEVVEGRLVQAESLRDLPKMVGRAVWI